MVVVVSGNRGKLVSSVLNVLGRGTSSKMVWATTFSTFLELTKRLLTLNFAPPPRACLLYLIILLSVSIMASFSMQVSAILHPRYSGLFVPAVTPFLTSYLPSEVGLGGQNYFRVWVLCRRLVATILGLIMVMLLLGDTLRTWPTCLRERSTFLCMGMYFFMHFILLLWVAMGTPTEDVQCSNREMLLASLGKMIVLGSMEVHYPLLVRVVSILGVLEIPLDFRTWETLLPKDTDHPRTGA